MMYQFPGLALLIGLSRTMGIPNAPVPRSEGKSAFRVSLISIAVCLAVFHYRSSIARAPLLWTSSFFSAP